MDLGIRGRRALVGGASGGLGRAIAERLAAEGCDLALSGRTPASLELAAVEIRERHGVRAVAVPADLHDEGAAADLATRAEEALGGVDILVLNAGGPPTSAADATEPDAWRAALQLLAVSPIDLATRLLPGMRAAGWGRIVAVLSYTIRQPVPDLAYSNAGRSALALWLKTTSRAVAADGVTMNGVMPGRFSTARIEVLDRDTAAKTGRTEAEVRAGHVAGIPAGRYGDPDELAAFATWLCSEPARYQTGTFTAIDGGLLAGYP